MSDLKQRLIFSSLFIIFSGLCLYFASNSIFKPFFTGIIALIACGALWEYSQIVKNKGIQIPLKISLFGSFIYVYIVFISTQWPTLTAMPECFLGLLLMAIFLHQFDKIKDSIVTIAVTFFGIIYIVYSLACLLKIAYFFPSTGHQDGRLWIVYLLIITKMSDVGGFLIGKQFGRHKLAKTLSPKKTMEGAFGGLCFSLLASMIFYLLSSYDYIHIDLSFVSAVFLGIALSLIGQFGDLAESLIKRDGGVKDSNPRIPGLGGILDIVDSLIFAIPFTYFFLLFSGAK